MRTRIKKCRHCQEDFNLFSKQKRKLGGKIDECPDCLEEMEYEDTPKYLGVADGEGKQSSITILAFENNQDRDAYHKAWRNNSGQNVGKKCNMGTHHTPMTGMKFRKVGENRGNANHKGKA